MLSAVIRVEAKASVGRTRPRLVPAAALLLAACGTTGAGLVPKTPRREAPDPTLEQRAELRAAEDLFRRADPAFAQQRERLARDPTTAWWLARMLVYQMVFALDQRQATEEELLRTAAGNTATPYRRAFDEVVMMGRAAVPCVVEDLLKLPQDHRRRLAIHLLGVIGPSALPELEAVLTSADPALRRLGAQAVAAMPPSQAAFERLAVAAQDPDFTVRAAAHEGLGRQGHAGHALLRRSLQTEADRFVQREIVAALAHDRSRLSAEALLEQMRRCLAAADVEGARSAQDALTRLAGPDARAGGSVRTGLASWELWVASLPPAWGAAEAERAPGAAGR
jgi:hypothetical protein